MKATKAVKKKKDVTYIYYVVDYLFWQVMIFRYELVKRTAKIAVVLDGEGKPKRLTLEDQSGKVCDDLATARVRAKDKLKERKAQLKEYEARLKKSREEIKAGRVRVIDPKALKNSKIEKYIF